MLPRFNLTSPALLIVLAAAFILPGLAGHDLWKSQDAIGLGIVYDMAASSDLVVPHIAGRAWVEDAPLYHWVALAFGLVFSFAMELHSAARLASGAFVAVALALMYRAGRAWTEHEADRPEQGPAAGAAAMLLLLGSVGLMVLAHEAIPELAALAFLCAAFAALPYAAARPALAGAGFGLSLGLAFLSGSWIAPAALFATVAVAHAACPAWRSRAAAFFLLLAVVCAALVALPWPLLLASRSPQAFAQWWSALWQPHASIAENARHVLANGSWFTWPAWPLALWSAWSLRRRWREPRLFVPGASLVLLLALQTLRGHPEDKSLLLLLAPLALLATPGLFTLRRGAVAALDWFGVLCFAFFTGLVWLGYCALALGVPGAVARNLARIAPGFVAPVHPGALAVALAFAVAWVYLVFYTPFNPMRSVARWAGGIVLLWGTFALLLMPWVDYQKSYRRVALQLDSRIPIGASCLAGRGLGISQAAALDYHGGIRTQPFDPLKPLACPLVLVQGDPGHELDAPPPADKGSWIKLADVGRPGDRAERFRLYRLRR